MKLRRLEIAHLPGIDRPFAVDGLSDAVNLVVGPNASGKSSLCRAVRATLWPGSPDAGPDARVRSRWRHGASDWAAELGAGRVAWQCDGHPESAPELPEAHLARCYTLALADLIDDDESRHGELASELLRELAGGFDLVPLRARHARARAVRFGRAEQERWQAAVRARRRIEDEQRALGRDEERLSDLRAARDRARTARSEAAGLERAAEAARHREAAAEATRELALQPPELARLQGHELAELDRIEGELAARRREAEAQEREIGAAEAEQRACALDRGPVAEGAIDAARASVRSWRHAREDLMAAERRTASAIGARESARAALAGGAASADEAAPPLEDDGLAAVDAWWRDAVALHETRRALEARRAALAGAPAEERAEAALARARRGAEHLRDWLAARRRRVLPALAAWTAWAGLTAALGVAIWRLPDPRAIAETLRRLEPVWAPVVVALAGIAWLAAAALATALPLEGRRVRRAHARAFGELELAPPDAWEREAVRRRLEALEAEVADRERRLWDAKEADRLVGEIGLLADREADLDARRRHLVERLRVDPGLDGLPLEDLARRLRTWREASTAAASAASEEGSCRRQAEDRAGALATTWKELFGSESVLPDDPDVAEEWIDDLERRSQRWRQAEASRNAARRERDHARRAAAEGERRRDEWLEALGLGAHDPAGARHRLEEWTGRLEAHRTWQGRLERARVQEEAISRGLADRPEWLALSAEQAEEAMRERLAVAETESALTEEIAAIAARLEQAGSAERLEDALAEEDEARRAWSDARDARFDAEAAALLLDEVEAEHEEIHQPAVLRRAADWFARFTHERFALRFERDGGVGRFRARENATGLGLELDQLSDGTRAQLGLAARLAFATGEERGTPLPLFLDEALSASDPQRFRAVVESLYALVAAGRQVFYLTCDPADVGLWSRIAADLGEAPPHVVDLAAVRGRQAAAEPAELAAPRLPEVPAPGGASAEDYAARLAVPLPRPFEPASALHLFHLLRDDLPLLHRLMSEARITRLGEWRTLRRHGGDRPWLEPAEAAHVDARADLAEAFFEAFGVGRGGPVERGVLVASEVVTEAFLDRLDGLAADLGRDARRFVRAIEENADERVKRFRNRDELRGFLASRGVLDERPILDTGQVTARVLARVAEHLSEGRLSADEVHRRVAEWWRYLDPDARSHS